MNTTTVVIDIQATHQAQKLNIKELYKFALDHLECLLNAYCHTGKPYYWEEALKQRKICEELSQRNSNCNGFSKRVIH
jgi:hypothetical protein